MSLYLNWLQGLIFCVAAYVVVLLRLGTSSLLSDTVDIPLELKLDPVNSAEKSIKTRYQANTLGPNQ